MSRSLDDIARRLKALEREVRAQKTATRLSMSSVEAGSVELNDAGGHTLGTLGVTQDEEGTSQAGIVIYGASSEGDNPTAASIAGTGMASVARISAGAVDLDGDDLAERLEALPRGIVALTRLPNDGPEYNSGTGRVLFGKIRLPNMDPTRQYKLGFTGRISITNPASDYVYIQAFARFDGEASTADRRIMEWQGARPATSGADEVFNVDAPFQDREAAGRDLYISLYVGGGDNVLNFAGSEYACIWVEDIGRAITEEDYDSGSYDPDEDQEDQPGGDPAPVQTYTKTYEATWSRSWRGDGSQRYGSNNFMYQGRVDSYNGNQKSWVGFNYNQIWSDLDGAEIVKFEVYFRFDHWYYNSGGTACLGYHWSDARGSYDGSLDNVDEVRSTKWPKPGARWVDVTGTSIATAFKNKVAKGVSLGPSPSASSLTYYGYARGAGQSNPPKIRITYRK